MCLVTFCTACDNPYLFLVAHYRSKPLPTYPAVHPLVSQSTRVAAVWLVWCPGLPGMSPDRHSRTGPRAPAQPTCCVSTGTHPHPAEISLAETTGIIYPKALPDLVILSPMTKDVRGGWGRCQCPGPSPACPCPLLALTNTSGWDRPEPNNGGGRKTPNFKTPQVSLPRR